MSDLTHKSREEFNTYLLVVVAHLIANQVRLNVAAYIAELTSRFGNWGTLFGKFIDPTVQTDDVVDDLDEEGAAIIGLLHTMYADIPESALTNTDREKLELPKKDGEKTPQNPLDHGPVLERGKIAHLVQQLRIKDPENPTKNGLPDGQKVILERHLGDAGIPDNAIPFAAPDLISRHLENLNFTENEVGKTEYLRACFVTSTGKKSPYSPVLRFIVT